MSSEDKQDPKNLLSTKDGASKSDHPKTNSFRLDRRHFIGALVGVSAAEVLRDSVKDATSKILGDGIVHFVSRKFNHPFESAGDSILDAKQLFFGTRQDYKVIPTELGTGGIDSDISSPSRVSLSEIRSLLHTGAGHIFERNTLEIRDYSGNIFVLGGPAANSFARLVLGTSGSSEILFSDQEAKLKFPFYFDINESTRRFNDGFGRYDSANGQTRRAPVWLLWNGDRYIIPEINEGKLVEDYVNLTCIPNILDADSFHRGCKIFLFTGAHGPAASAAGLLIKNKRLIEQISDINHHNRAWQAILGIDELDADKPIEMIENVIKFQRIDANFEEMAKAISPFGAL